MAPSESEGQPTSDRGTSVPSVSDSQSQLEGGRDPRLFIYAGLDLVMATLYAVILFGLIPNRHGWVQALSILVVVATVAMAVSMVIRRRWSWWAGVGSCATLLTVAVVFLLLTLTSAAFLAGVYGSFGRAAAALSLIGAALVIELVALLPAFQLKFLMTRAGRRSFGLAPIGRR